MREVWGAYSVKDHLSRKPFVADVMLYDRLVIPRPAAGDEAHWKNWNPARQDKILKILGDRAMSITWDAALQAEWQSRWDAAKAIGRQTNREAFRLTPTVLITQMPKHVTGVVAVAAFESPSELQKQMDLKENPAASVAGGTPNIGAAGPLVAIIGREFLVPDDPSWIDDDLLRSAVDLSSDMRFKRKRAAYWRWQQEFLGNSTVLDQAAIDDAVDEMRELIEEEKAEARKARIKLGVSCAFAVGAATIGLFAGPIAPCAVGAAFLSVGGWVFDRATEQAQEPGPAAMCYSAQREFGWKSN